MRSDRFGLTRALGGTACALGLAWTTISAAAPADMIGDAPLHYIGSIDFDPELGRLAAGWAIIATEDDLDTLTFALSSAVGTAQVTGSGVRAVTSELDPRFGGAVRLYNVALNPSVNGSDRVVKFAYDGPLFSEAPPLPINTLDADKIELTVDSFWFPFDARFETDLTARLHVRAPGDWSAVSVGEVAYRAGGFDLTQADPSLDIAFSLLSSSETIEAPGYVIHDARTEKGEKIADLTEALAFCTAYLNRLAGPAGPLPQASIVVTDRADGGYSRGTLIALTDIENEDEEALHQFICHELAHYWSHANAGGPENWINEGVADYLANMAVREALGETVFDARMTRYAEQLVGHDLPPIWTEDATARPPYLNMYRAAPLALRALESRMGSEPFAAFMRAVMVEETATTPELLSLLERVAGEDTRNWFEARLES